MKQQILLLTVAATSILAAQTLRVVAATKSPLIVVTGRTVIAFCPPSTKTQLQKDADTSEALADFQLYSSQVREPLRKADIGFYELHTASFRVRVGKEISTFRASKVDIGYYLIAPGKAPRVEYGVMTASDLLQVADEYFKVQAK